MFSSTGTNERLYFNICVIFLGRTNPLLHSLGKRFTWSVIKALTSHDVADDWNFSQKLNANPVAIKTSWPHHEGIWNWGNQMDQVLLLIRNPRWAIPSYQ